MMEQV